jgi:hypothetical protein
MPASVKKAYQNTTVRMPRRVFEKAKTMAVRAQAASFNEFVIQAVEEKLRRLSEAEIDEAFAHMAHDADYRHDSVALARAFEKSDWEALQAAPTHERPAPDKPDDKPKTRAPKTRSR